MLSDSEILSSSLRELLQKSSYIKDMLIALDIHIYDEKVIFSDLLSEIPDIWFEDHGICKKELVDDVVQHLNSMINHNLCECVVDTITLKGGIDKFGKTEQHELIIKKGEIISVVGETGAGKSQLLEDIEYLSQGDTPSGRIVLINNRCVSEDERLELENSLCAKLSQNMNFVMDLSVREFIEFHAQCRLNDKSEEKIAAIANVIIEYANELAGEKFSPEISVTRLSGGQSRSLMIADVALLSNSPVILIDELENAGIDRDKALELLSSQGKMIIISTHDPILALAGDKRVVIKNGGIDKIITSNENEKMILQTLKKYDKYFMKIRNELRMGKMVEEIYFE